MKGRIRQITVIGNAQIDKKGYEFAEKVGKEIANLGFAIVTGGRGGIMEAVNKGAFQAGGISIGILPSSSILEANQYCNIVIPTGMGDARNAITALACDALVSIGGGAGTLSEICFGWIYKKPIFVFEQFG
ncbi:MAG: TIGR00725 family protein, partial [Cytophagales bacterium]|nr:TIGR00725 family protein [Cytophagales bacterium]